MKDAANKWFEQTPWREGFVACALRFPDASILAKARGNGFGSEPLAKAAQHTHEIIQSLEKSSLNFGRVCLVYNNALMHAERRADGICFSVFTVREEKAYDAAGLEKLFTEFQSLKASA